MKDQGRIGQAFLCGIRRLEGLRAYRACGCGPEGFAQDYLEDVWPAGALGRCYPTGRVRAMSLSPAGSVSACLGPCWNTISELKISDAAGTVQVGSVAATAYLIC